jgi:K(+)-stimulated pyrophosphate-energized sodium pump
MSVLALIAALFFARQITRGMEQISAAIKLGAEAFLKRQYKIVAAVLGLGLLPALASAQTEQKGGGEASLVLPDLSSVSFLGLNGHTLLMIGLLFCVGGL